VEPLLRVRLVGEQPARVATATAAPRDAALSLLNIDDTWWSIVLGDTNSFAPMSAFDSPSASAASSCSRAVSPNALPPRGLQPREVREPPAQPRCRRPS
jgi:hypothetical protein